MKTSTGPDSAPASIGRLRILVIVALGVAALALIGGVVAMREGDVDATILYYEVKRADLPITVKERGNLESQNEIAVRCEVDDIEGDNLRGTPIVWIIPNGSRVGEGDLVVELDSAALQERLDRQILDTERARSEQIQARVKFENQKTQNETNFAEAQLKVDLAELALLQFEDDEGGTFQIRLQDIELDIQEAQASRLIESTNLEGVTKLYEIGYRSRGELAQARLTALRAESQLVSAISKRKELVKYQYRMTKLELAGQLASAKRALQQVERDNEAMLEQARAAMEAADQSLEKEEERKARYSDQLEKCKIYSPQEGMVAYATGGDGWRREEIREGAVVRPRQVILTLPNLRRMQLRTAVHESVRDQIRPGLPATVRVNSFQDRTFAGSVASVAVLPDQNSWMSSDTKVYETVVFIDEDVDQLKPGMTAVAEIHVDRLRDVLSVPVTAIVQVGPTSWCYVNKGGAPVKREVVLGRTNDKFVELRNGVEEGERVALNPDDIFDKAERQAPALSPETGAGQPPPRSEDADAEATPGELGANVGEDGAMGGTIGASYDPSDGARPTRGGGGEGAARFGGGGEPGARSGTRTFGSGGQRVGQSGFDPSAGPRGRPPGGSGERRMRGEGRGGGGGDRGADRGQRSGGGERRSRESSR